MWGQSDYSTTYTSNVTLSTAGGTNAYECTVGINGTDYDGIKAGTSSKAGAVRITAPAGSKYLHLHLAGWKGENVTVSITPNTNITPSSLSLTADDGISGSGSSYSISGTASDYYQVITFTTPLASNTNFTITATSGKRFVVFGVNSEALPSYSITAVSSNDEWGTVSCEGTTITATPAVGYRVVAGDGGYTVTTGNAAVVNNGDNTFTVTPSTDCTVQINFEAIPTHTVTVTGTGGTITVKDGEDVIASGSSVREGTELTITAVAGVGKVFNSWNLTGATPASATAATTTFTMGTSDVTVAANYDDATTHAISWSVNGNIIRTDNIVEGEDIDFPTAITGIPNGYELTGWVLSANKIDTPTDTDPSANYVTAATSTADVTYYAVMAVVTGSTPASWSEVALNALTASDIFVIVGDNGDTYAMTNNNGTTNPPAASEVTISEGKITSSVADNIKWNVTGNNTDGYTFYPNGTTASWLYCTNSNNGVRVGTNNAKTFKLDGTSGYLIHDGTSRYVGVYNSQDWRCYTSINANIENQEFSFYKYNAPQKLYAGYCTTVAPEAVAIGAAGMATFCSTKDLDFTDVAEIDVYKATVEGTTINFTRIKKVPANTGVLLRNSSGAKAAVEVNVPVLSGDTDDVTGNLFVAATVEIGSLASSADGYKNYILNDGANGLGFYLANGHKVGAGKAYLHVPESAAKGFITFDDATGIELVNTASDMNTAIYNLQGQRVSEGYKGVVIVNGKKIMMK